MNDKLRQQIASMADSVAFDLGRPLSEQTPRTPSHMPVMHRLARTHADGIDANGMSTSNDILAMGTHVGTHLDGLAHIGADGCLAGGVATADVEEGIRGFSGGFGMESVPPLIMPAVLVDIAGFQGVDEVAADHQISSKELADALVRQEAAIPEGGALLIRTGYGRGWPDVKVSMTASPGPGLEAVEWAWDQGARLYGSDTIVFERLPSESYPVHRELLVHRGVHILEALALDGLAEAKAWEFLVIVAPLALQGATGSPVRPVALVPPSA